MKYVERNYRQWHSQKDLVHFQVIVKQTDLDIAVNRERFSPELAARVEEVVKKFRQQLEEYIRKDSKFVKALEPYRPAQAAPPIVKDMIKAANLAGVGPMAAVAGAFSQYVGEWLSRHTKEFIIENGGDIYMRTAKKRKIGIFAGESPFSQRIALEILPEQTPLGICTSSGTVGHSLSFGQADAVTILSPSAVLADAVATAAANLVKSAEDLQAAVDFALAIKGVSGALAIYRDKMAVRGQVKLIPL